MARKKYLIRQERKFNGDVTRASLTYECEEAEVSAIVAKLEGVITVMEENVALSSAEGATNLITGGLVIDSVAMVHSEAKTKYFGAYDKPFVFKATTSITELQAMFELHKPFTGASIAEKPDVAYPKLGNIGQL